MSLRPLTKTVIAIVSPILAIAVFYGAVRAGSTNSRVLDGSLTTLLLIGAYNGISAFREKTAHIGVRGLGLLAAIVCVPSGAAMLVIMVFGLA